MLFWDAMVLIVLIAAVVLVLLMRQRGSAHAAGSDTADLARSRAEIDELKARIQVLERVVTDTHGSHQLDADIERLRDR
ncbi:hypothetical protein [Sphingomonas sp.]|uniref:hypothetical protein n=1 Tax=Sphingomonas sp. TaxID=28214 RepID=UPI003B002FC9